MHLEYEKADRNDLEVIYEMAKKLIYLYEDPTVVDLHRALSWTRTKIEGNYEAYTRVLKDGKIVGYYHLIPQIDLRNELDDFYILPEYRGQGIGGTVLEHILDEIEDPTYVYVFRKNERAKNLYRKYGFQETKIVSPTRMILEVKRK